MGATRTFALREALRCAEILKGLGGECFPDRMWRYWGPSMNSDLEERLYMPSPYLSVDEENALTQQQLEEERKNKCTAGGDACHTPGQAGSVAVYDIELDPARSSAPHPVVRCVPVAEFTDEDHNFIKQMMEREPDVMYEDDKMI